MPRIDQQENQTLEFKRQWTDKALEDLAAFANTEGGTLLVGIRDDGEIVGTTADDREIQRLANLISSRLGITQPGMPEPDLPRRLLGDFSDYLAKHGITSRGVRYVRRAQKGLIGLTKGSQTAQRCQRAASKEPQKAQQWRNKGANGA
jgi:ATP-dependent DNA helicase RecG